MSKAFTKEDDDAGIEPISASRGLPVAPFRLTREGARKLAKIGDERSREALHRAELVDAIEASPDRAAIGVSVEVCDAEGRSHVYRLVSAEEHVLIGEGCSVVSPIGRALLGALPGDVREVNVPRGAIELRVVALRGDGTS